MKTSFWTPYISDHTIKAICWTLIHSLWIGLAIALLAGLVVSVTRKSSAALRYNLLCGVLVLFVLSVGVTFGLEMHSPGTGQFAINTGGGVYHIDNAIITVSKAEVHLSLLDRTIAFLNQYANVIFIAWLLFFVLKSLKMVSGLLYIQRIRNYKVHEVAEEFKNKIGEFSMQIGIKRAVNLMQSELVKVPVAVGWLKPVILLPVGIILQLSTEQLESILWHELAHIRRRDYLVNILQGLVETVFFFNPGLLWLSSLIRAEREACCDDMVLRRMDRKANYLEALLSFGSEDRNRTSLAMSIGSGNQLRDRLKRMISQENKRLSIAEKVVLAVGLVLLSAFTTMPKTTTRAMQSLIHVITKKHDTVAAPKTAITKAANQVQPTHHKQSAFDEDTTVKKRDTAINFVSVLFNKNDADLANAEIDAMDDKGNRYHFMVVNNKLMAMEVNHVKVNDSDLAANEYMIRNIDRVVEEKRIFMADHVERFKENSAFTKFKKSDKFSFDKKRFLDSPRFKINNVKPKLYKSELWKEPAPMYMKSDAMIQRMRQDSANYAAEQARANGVIADLVAEKVVANASAVKWFGLTNDELIVNGQKQPDALQQKLKAKYGVQEDSGLYYGPVEMTGKGVFIDNDAQALQRSSFQQLRLKQQQFALQDMRLKQPQQFKMKPFSTELAMKQRNTARLDMKEKGFFNSAIPLNDIISNVTDDLVTENVIKDKSDLASFKLTNKFLTVNGKKQPDEIHEKLRNKYLSALRYELTPQIMKDPNFGMHYDSKSGSMGLGIDIEKNDP
ncbi:MAG: M56 family metallopeptidase [Sphingobacteriales bacterium]